ncbi:MAG: lanthionine synthetase LanC family protein [Streptosporangiaceae bacterium]
MTTAQEQALTVGRLLLETASVEDALPERSRASMAHGLAGTALLHARLSAADPVFAVAASRHWERAAQLIRRSNDSGAGVFADRGGLAASLIIGSAMLPDPAPHHAAAQQAARWLSASASRIAETMSDPSWAAYDVINGLAGIGRVLLTARADGHHEAEPGLLAALRALTSMLSLRDGPRPGWWIPASRHPSTVTVHPSGGATTGMAHGVAGPLAFVAAAHAAGHTTSGQEAAIRNAAEWLLQWRTPGTWRWPPTITGDQLEGHESPPVPGRSDAWCYGTPGIARALAIAGLALADPSITEASTTALDSLAQRPPGQWDTEGPALCHGTAGVLQSAKTSPALADASASQLTQKIGQEEDPFGFTASPGLLTGAAGTALALADHGQLPAPPGCSSWDALLLLS